MKYYILIILLVMVTSVCNAQTATPTATSTPTDIKYVCQNCSLQPHYSTINTALGYANTGDTIQIIWESLQDSTYTENLLIDKRITLTSDGTGDDLPVIQADINFPAGNADPIIEVTANQVFITHLKIRNNDPYYSGSSPPSPSSSDEIIMDREVGILINATGCTVYNCEVTRCRVGILLDPDNVTQWHNVIESCRIGGIKDGANPYWYFPYSTYIHDGNFFGIVHIAPDRAAADMTDKYFPDEIINCTIQGNRVYGVVLRNGSQAFVTNNLIIWNGTADALSNNQHYGDGGLLSLFTSAELTPVPDSDEVDVQSPKIYSNTIFGNNGYQVCVVSENTDFRDISNIPVIMNNNIGPNPFYEGSPTPEAGFPHLVSCMSESTYSATVPQYGSAPILAFNNIYREWPETDKSRRNYYQHPLEAPTPGPTDTPAVPPTSTPVPPNTWTPQPPGTPFPPTPDIPTYTPTVPDAYTPIPASPAPTPFDYTPPPTPTGLDYQINAENGSWQIADAHHSHGFMGGTEPSEFDFHLSNPEFQPTPTVTASPRSACLNAGPFDLQPGQTRETPVPDTGWVDMGRHIKPDVPPVENMAIVYGLNPVPVIWDLPTHYSDDRLFDDIQGNILHWGRVLVRNGPIIPVGYPVYIPLCERILISSEDIPPSANRIGIAVYNNRGESSPTEWKLSP